MEPLILQTVKVLAAADRRFADLVALWDAMHRG
jgi:hypothetical protein